MNGMAKQCENIQISLSALELERIIHFVLYGSFERSEHKLITAVAAEIVQRALWGTKQ